MSKPVLHDQDWRDFQPFPDPEIKVSKIARGLKAADERSKAKAAPANVKESKPVEVRTVKGSASRS